MIVSSGREFESPQLHHPKKLGNQYRRKILLIRSLRLFVCSLLEFKRGYNLKNTFTISDSRNPWFKRFLKQFYTGKKNILMVRFRLLSR